MVPKIILKNGHNFEGLMHRFAAMVLNEDTTDGLNQLPKSLDVIRFSKNSFNACSEKVKF